MIVERWPRRCCRWCVRSTRASAEEPPATVPRARASAEDPPSFVPRVRASAGEPPSSASRGRPRRERGGAGLPEIGSAARSERAGPRDPCSDGTRGVGRETSRPACSEDAESERVPLSWMLSASLFLLTRGPPPRLATKSQPHPNDRSRLALALRPSATGAHGTSRRQARAREHRAAHAPARQVQRCCRDRGGPPSSHLRHRRPTP